MDLRDEINKKVLESKADNLLIYLATGLGKTKVSLDKMNALEPKSVLIVIPRMVLIANWKKEIIKWGYKDYLDVIEFSSYVGLKNKSDKYELIIFDEAHNLTEKSAKYITGWSNKYNIFLSATPNVRLNNIILYTLLIPQPNIDIIEVSVKEAIENEVLSKPEIVKIPLNLKDFDYLTHYYKHSKGYMNSTTTYEFKDRFQAFKNKRTNVLIKCNSSQYYELLMNRAKFLRQTMNEELDDTKKMKTAKIYLRTRKDILEFLSSIKNYYVLRHLKSIDDSRRLMIFCSNIKQAEVMCEYNVHSKSKKSMKLLDDFNNHKINRLSSCNMLNEGLNLVDCELGLFMTINSSSLMMIQKIGRIIRHEKPKIVLYYFRDTREEELIKEIVDMYEDNN